MNGFLSFLQWITRGRAAELPVYCVDDISKPDIDPGPAPEWPNNVLSVTLGNGTVYYTNDSPVPEWTRVPPEASLDDLP